MRQIIRATACAFLASAAHADEPTFLNYNEITGLIAHSTLEVSDNVNGNCWTNANTVKSKIHLLYEQNGIFVPDYEISGLTHYTARTNLFASGDRNASNQCLVIVQYDVYVRSRVEYGGWYDHKFYSAPIFAVHSDAAAFTSSTTVNEQIEDFAIGAASEFLAKHISARRSDAVTAFNELYEPPKKPMSMQEWEEQNGE